MKKFFYKTVLFSCSALMLFSCGKDEHNSLPTPQNPVDPAPPAGAYILSEGGFGGNNTKLGYYAFGTGVTIGDFFIQQNPSVTGGLGDTGNDVIIYGSKMYIVVTGSGRVTVLNAANGTFIKNVSFLSGTVNRQPRYAVGARGKVYVTAYDNTVSAIDTAALSIVKTINVGPNPEGIAASSNFLYVANSGGYSAIPDSTVSFIDLTTETEIRKIKVGLNPNKIEINGAGKVFVSAYGNFGSVPPSVSVIDGAVNMTSVSLGAGFPYSHLRLFGDLAYFYNNYGGAGTAKVYNTSTSAVVRNEFITDGTVVQTPYGINADDTNGDIYIADAGNYISAGKVICFNNAGQKKFSFSTAPGVNPNKIIIKH